MYITAGLATVDAGVVDGVRCRHGIQDRIAFLMKEAGVDAETAEIVARYIGGEGMVSISRGMGVSYDKVVRVSRAVDDATVDGDVTEEES